MTAEEKASARAELDKRMPMFLPIAPDQWICECGERRKLFYNRERLRCISCPVCDLSEVFAWINGFIPNRPKLTVYDRIFLKELVILSYDPDPNDFNLNVFDIAFLQGFGIGAR